MPYGPVRSRVVLLSTQYLSVFLIQTGTGYSRPVRKYRNIIPRHIKVPKLKLFPLYQIFFNKKRLIVNNDANLWAMIGKKLKDKLRLKLCQAQVKLS